MFFWLESLNKWTKTNRIFSDFKFAFMSDQSNWGSPVTRENVFGNVSEGKEGTMCSALTPSSTNSVRRNEKRFLAKNWSNLSALRPPSDMSSKGFFALDSTAVAVNVNTARTTAKANIFSFWSFVFFLFSWREKYFKKLKFLRSYILSQ